MLLVAAVLGPALLAGCANGKATVSGSPYLPPMSAAIPTFDSPSAPAAVASSEPAPVTISLAPSVVAPTSLAEERDAAIYKVGKPYVVGGKTYVPRHDPDYEATGFASWYGPQFHGKSTANGETYNMKRLSAAHPTLPMPCYVEVTNLENGRTIAVRVNDRGPYKRGRIIDLSQRAAELLGYAGKGTAKVQVRYLRRAPLGPDDSFEMAYLERQPWYHGSVASAPRKAKAKAPVTETSSIGVASGWESEAAAIVADAGTVPSADPEVPWTGWVTASGSGPVAPEPSVVPARIGG